jgi:hypothetical protein
MIVSKSNPSSYLDTLCADAAKTRSVLEAMLTKSFDPSSMPSMKLDRPETARFIAEQARKLRLAAIAADQISLIWMIENLYYEAFALGCSKNKQGNLPNCQRGSSN